jgi:hypothetical protein
MRLDDRSMEPRMNVGCCRLAGSGARRIGGPGGARSRRTREYAAQMGQGIRGGLAAFVAGRRADEARAIGDRAAAERGRQGVSHF